MSGQLPSWSARDLQALRERLRDEADEIWDLVVVGGGITGMGVARDAAQRGLRVLVLEARDLAHGTSSRSSRLVHGGVRYLEHGELGLVFEALRERRTLYRTAPHLVRPARFLFPSYQGDRLGPFKLRVGLSLYRALDRLRGEGTEFLGAEQARAREPLLTAHGLRGAAIYEDAITDDARLTLAVALDARRHGAEILTYAPVQAVRALERGGYVVDAERGLAVRTRACVIAAGPWTGTRLLGETAEGLLALSKGVHLVMRSSDVPVRAPVVVQVRRQRRILFVVPWGARTYLGTTDTPYEGDPGAAGVTAADEAEVLRIVRRVLRGAELGAGRIVSAWSGVRPLVRPADAEPGESTVEVSRTHRIVTRPDGVIAVVGGKLTTYRAMAEEVVDAVNRSLSYLEGGARTWAPCRTATTDLVPGPPVEPEEAAADPVLADLVPRHGPLARTLAARARKHSELAERLVADLPYRFVEVVHAIEHEACVHLHDLLRRRLPLSLTDPRLGGGVMRRVAEALIDARGGTAADVDEEIELYRELVHVETRRRPR